MASWEYLTLESNGFSGDVSKWIYSVNGERSEGGHVSERLDQLGGEGWEMVGFEGKTYVFKRPTIMTEPGEWRQSELRL